jgi:hypothetical protein
VWLPNRDQMSYSACQVGPTVSYSCLTRYAAQGACRYLISQHPHVEAKICEELDALGLLATVNRPSPRPLRYEDLAEMTYLSCVVKVRRRRVPLRHCAHGCSL